MLPKQFIIKYLKRFEHFFSLNVYRIKVGEMNISKEITIEELIEVVPQSVKYLMDKGIKCIACGEPIWGTLEDAAREKGLSDEEITRIVEELQNL